MSVDDNHAEAIAYRYRGEEAAAERIAHLSTAELVERAEASRGSHGYMDDWAALRVLADRSGIAHTFEAGYSLDLEARYAAVRSLAPDADPDEWGGAFDAAYDAYADAHPEIPVPTERALAWGRAQIGA